MEGWTSVSLFDGCCFRLIWWNVVGSGPTMGPSIGLSSRRLRLSATTLNVAICMTVLRMDLRLTYLVIGDGASQMRGT